DNLADGTARGEAQAGDVTLAPKLELEDGHVNWNAAADMVTNQIRGVTPEPGAFALLDGSRFKIVDAVVARDAARLDAGRLALDGRRVLVGTATTPLELITVHPAGKRPMPAADWWRGRPSDAPAELS
ncbi:MAG: methionyl-tRNA formyltransferase, partial [Leifsonia sp.]